MTIKPNHGLLISVLLLNSLSVTAKPYSVDISDNTQSLYHSGSSTPIIGSGYNSDYERGVNACLLGEYRYVGSPDGSFIFNKNYQYSDLRKDLNIDHNLSSGIKGLFSFKSKTEFTHSIQETELNETVLGAAKFTLRSRAWQTPTDSSPLTWLGQQYAQSPEQFRLWCGDTYIKEQALGGMVIIAAQLHFKNKTDKKTFNTHLGGSIGIGDIFSTNVKLKKAITAIDKQGSLSIKAVQYGGDPSKLTTILGGKDGTADVLNCSLDDMEACSNTLTNIFAYISDESTGFPSQFYEDTDTSINGPQILSNVTFPYAAVGVPIESETVLTADIIKYRQLLAQALTKQYDNQAILESILQGGRLDIGVREAIEDAITRLNDNIESLTTTGQLCFENLTDCVALAQRTFQQLKAFNEDLLDIEPGKIYGRFSCDYPENASQYSTFRITWHPYEEGDKAKLRIWYPDGTEMGNVKNFEQLPYLQKLTDDFGQGYQYKAVGVQGNWRHVIEVNGQEVASVICVP